MCTRRSSSGFTQWSIAASVVFTIASICSAQDISVKRLLEKIDKQEKLIQKLQDQLRVLTANKAANAAFDLRRVKGVIDPQTFSKLLSIEKEIHRLQIAGFTDVARKMRIELHSFVKQATGQISNNVGQPEMHFVGVYEGLLPKNKKRQFRQHPEGLVEVSVEYAGGPIILVLSSYEPVLWKLKVSKTADIRRLILAGHHKQRLEGLPKSVVIQQSFKGKRLRSLGLPGRDDEQMLKSIRLLKQMTNTRPATMLGSYGYRGAPFVVGPSNGDWRRQLLEQRIQSAYQKATEFERQQRRKRFQAVRFQGIFHKRQVRDSQRRRRPAAQTVWFSSFTPSGPLASTMLPVSAQGQHVTLDPKKQSFYAIANHHVALLEQKTNQLKQLSPIPPNVPKLSWPSALTFDAKRRRLVLVSFGGQGFMYAYSVDTKKWKLITSLKHRGMSAICYAANKDVIYGLHKQHRGPSRLFTYSPGGVLLNETAVNLPPNPGNSRLRRGGSGGVQLCTAGGYVALMSRKSEVQGTKVVERSKCYIIDPKNGRIVFSDWMKPHAGEVVLSRVELRKLWTQLLSDADEELLVWRLAAGGEMAVRLIGKSLQPVKTPNQAEIRKWIKWLTSDRFAVRSKAQKRLAALAGSANDQLRQALKSAKSVELKSALTRLLKASATAALLSPEIRRELRAVTALGRINSPSARKLLRQLSNDAVESARRTAARRLLKQAEQ